MPEQPEPTREPTDVPEAYFDRFKDMAEFLSAVDRNPHEFPVNEQTEEMRLSHEESMKIIRDEIGRQSSLDYDQMIERKTGKKMHQRLPREYIAIVENIRFRLAGFSGFEDANDSAETADGVRKRLEKDLYTVRSIEKKLVLNPADARRELKALPEALKKVGNDYQGLNSAQFPFARRGRHLNVVSPKKLRSVWEDGYVVLAEIKTGEETYFPVGYLYGLLSAPASQKDDKDLDPNFPNLDLRDVGIPDERRAIAIRDRNAMIAIWRTSVRESVNRTMVQRAGLEWSFEEKELELRRVGIGTALKNIIMRAAAIHGKMWATLNVGELRLKDDATLHMPNQASMNYNQEFLHPWGWRQKYHNRIVLGKKHVASMYWLAHHNAILTAIQEMERPGGVLQGKGWLSDNISRSNLGRDGITVADALFKAQKMGLKKSHEK